MSRSLLGSPLALVHCVRGVIATGGASSDFHSSSEASQGTAADDTERVGDERVGSNVALIVFSDGEEEFGDGF